MLGPNRIPSSYRKMNLTSFQSVKRVRLCCTIMGNRHGLPEYKEHRLVMRQPVQQCFSSPSRERSFGSYHVTRRC